ncbi:MAG: DHH family phosphoesterase, partial [Candidatus Uhrbacteria bacterium]
MEAIKHRQINQALIRANHVLILPDERIDGDSLGATLSLYRYLDRINKKVTIVCSDQTPEIYRFLDHIDLCLFDQGLLNDKTIDLVICVDSSDIKYVESLTDQIPGRVSVINIDHHDSNPGYGDLVQVIPGQSATTEIIYNFFQENNIYIDPEMATALLTGIYYDTTVFSNKSTRDRSLAIASDLFMLGARVQQIVQNLQLNRSLAVLKIWGLALERLRKHPILDVVVTCITLKDLEETKASDESLNGLTNFLHGIIDIDSLVVLCEVPEGVNGSMRTMNGDVATLAQYFGGGGHTKASGFTIPDARIIEKNG